MTGASRHVQEAAAGCHDQRSEYGQPEAVGLARVDTVPTGWGAVGAKSGVKTGFRQPAPVEGSEPMPQPHVQWGTAGSILTETTTRSHGTEA